ncbi:hypothetical protein ETD86_30075 [Nonomuraea turkmeniaca]|uniref:Uncharacterized protein n=1 Tax=Nonomuraea turkmeniaca TaxID=103838 RepID=A0A5S4FA09_9ACTN|nr:hypothetical protein [Nonomuraea turkmeniaca]TMR13814.1 hypothetical protein ETD86_30075 [Nonomuraea turkmeniaca]
MSDTSAPDYLSPKGVAVRARRLDVIARAITYLDSTPTADLVTQLADVSRRDALQEPAALADFLRSITMHSDTADVFAGWKVAQNTLRAAGLPHD